MSNLHKKVYSVFVDGENYGDGNVPNGPVSGLEPAITAIIDLASGVSFHAAPYNFTLALTEAPHDGSTAPYIGGLYKFEIDWKTFDVRGENDPDTAPKDFFIAINLDPGGTVLGGEDDTVVMQISHDDIANRVQAAMLKKLFEMETGDWEIESNEMSIKKDNVELARYKLFDKAGSPTNTNVFKRTLKTLSELT